MLTTSDIELITILIMVSILMYTVWRDFVFLCTKLLNKIMRKGKKDGKNEKSENNITKINGNLSIDDVCRDKRSC